MCGGHHGGPGSLSAAGIRGTCADSRRRPGTVSDWILGFCGVLRAEGVILGCAHPQSGQVGGAQGRRQVPFSMAVTPPIPRAIFFLGDSGCGGLFICWGQVGPGQAWQRPRTGFSLPCRISGFEEGDHHCCLSPRLGTHHLRHLLTHTHLLSFD